MSRHARLDANFSHLPEADLFINIWRMFLQGLNPLSANPTKWSNTLKQFDCRGAV